MNRGMTFGVLLMLSGLVLACGGEEGSADPNAASEATQDGAAAVAQVCNGARHTCVMRATGEVFCSGRNLDGELGDGTAQTRWTWVPVQGVSGATQLACRGGHSCAITGSGVFCWGQNTNGQLGAGNADVTHSAVQVQGLTDATQLAIGEGFSCARRSSGAVSCWGDGSNGRLGNGATDPSASPVAVSGLSDAVEVAAGRAHACASKADGTVVCWGAARSGQVGQGGERPRDSVTPIAAQGVAGATHVAAGGNHSCAVTASGVMCWGQNNYGQSGAGEENIMVPTAVAGLTGATQLRLARSRTCALVGGGAVQCWGYNNHTAQLLGVGSEEQKVTTPTNVIGLTGIRDFDTSGASTSGSACGLNAANQLWCWGTAADGRFGNGEPRSLHQAAVVQADVNALAAPASTPATFAASAAGLEAETSFEVGSHTVCGVKDGQVLCFGSGADGRLGTGSTRANPSGGAVPAAGITDAVQVSTGLTRTCALRKDGSVACWGKLTSRVSTSSPIAMEGISDARAINVGGSADTMSLCVVHQDGGVSCAGSPLGERGETSLTATRVAGLSDITQVNVGTDSACALQASGKVFCWGSARYGQLGNGSDERSATPVEVSGIRDAVDIGGGGYNQCALRRSGAVSCWGSGDDGQLANGETGREANSATPVAISGLRGVASLSKFGDSMCAAQRNGAGSCWGANDFGQTGHDDADTDDVTSPWEYMRNNTEATSALGDIIEMGCGWNFCCALHASGGVSCAGSTPVEQDGADNNTIRNAVLSFFTANQTIRSATPVPASITYSVHNSED